MRLDTKQQLLFLFDSVFETFFPLVPLELVWVHAICLQPLIGEPHPIIRFLLLGYLIFLVLEVLRGFLTRRLGLFGGILSWFCEQTCHSISLDSNSLQSTFLLFLAESTQELHLVSTAAHRRISAVPVLPNSRQ